MDLADYFFGGREETPGETSVEAESQEEKSVRYINGTRALARQVPHVSYIAGPILWHTCSESEDPSQCKLTNTKLQTTYPGDDTVDM